jgi:hypothetical protein
VNEFEISEETESYHAAVSKNETVFENGPLNKNHVATWHAEANCDLSIESSTWTVSVLETLSFFAGKPESGERDEHSCRGQAENDQDQGLGHHPTSKYFELPACRLSSINLR